MKKYLVTFDLDTTEDDRSDAYHSAEEYLNRFKYHEKPIRNTYLVADENDKISAVRIRDSLKDFFKKDDKIAVVQIDGDWAWRNCEQSSKDALKNILSL